MKRIKLVGPMAIEHDAVATTGASKLVYLREDTEEKMNSRERE